MKKRLAFFMSIVMIISAFAVACSKAEETTKKKKKKTKKTSRTEITEMTETELPTDTEPTDSFSIETSPTPTVPAPKSDPMTISHDLTDLGVMRDATCYQYGAMDPTADGYVNYEAVQVRFYCETVSVLDGGTKFVKDLNEMFSSIIDSGKQTYDDSVSKFLSAQQNGETLPYLTLNENATIYRADSQVFSFELSAEIYGYDIESESSSFYANVDPNTSMDIEMSDIITDVDAFCDILDMYLYTKETSYRNEVKDAIRSGEDTVFAITYDGIVIDGIKIPVYGHEDCINMEYFGKTPSEYCLLLDQNNVLEWDFDGDGVFEDLSVDYQNSELTVHFNKNNYVFGEDQIPDISKMDDLAWNSPHVLMCSPDMCKFIVSMNYSETVERLIIFDLSSGEPVFENVVEGRIVGVPLNPSDLRIGEDIDLVGGREMCRDYVLQADGSMVPQTAFVYMHSYPFVLSEDVTGDEFDWNTGDVKGKYTIKKDTAIEIIAYHPNSGAIVFKTLEPDVNDCKYVQLESDKVDHVGGKDMDDLFPNQIYIGG